MCPQAEFHNKNIEDGFVLLDEKSIDTDYNRIHTKEAIKQRGEVFTPTPLVNEMLDKLQECDPTTFKKPDETFLDNSCGNGQFLAVVLERKLNNGIDLKTALSTIYGVDIDSKNVDECKKRLACGNDNTEILEILDHNIICADALDENHSGWKEVGYMWDENKKHLDLTDLPFFAIEEGTVGT